MDTSTLSGGVLIAAIATAQILLLAAMQSWAAARKDKRDAERKSLEKQEDYARQDVVAERVTTAAKQAAEAARLLVTANEEAKLRTDEVARLAATSQRKTVEALAKIDEQTQKIHTLVNSDMTAARTNERDTLVRLLAALRKVDGGTPGELEELVKVEKRIEELGIILADRLAAQNVVDAQAKSARIV
jgi:hypothetical protein